MAGKKIRRRMSSESSAGGEDEGDQRLGGGGGKKLGVAGGGVRVKGTRLWGKVGGSQKGRRRGSSTGAGEGGTSD